MRDTQGIVEFTLLIEKDNILVPTLEYFHGGTTYVEGQIGQRYALRVLNLCSARVEVVPSVDGLDVQSGKDASFDLRGLVLRANQSYDFTGFRLNQSEVATFRFGGIDESYAAQIGKPRNVGVIGLAVFRELAPVPPPPPPVAAPLQKGFGPPPASLGSRPGFPPPQPGCPPPGSPPAQGGFGMPSPAPAPSALGTKFGERREARVTSTSFDRATSKPVEVLSIRYEDRQSLRALGIDVDGLAQRETANPFPAESSYAKPPPGWRG